LEFLLVPFLSRALPRYTLHRQSGQARVSIGGKQVLLGKFNSPESRQKYDLVVGQWIAAGRPRARALALELHAVRVSDLITSYFEFVKKIFRDRKSNGDLAGTARNYKMLLWQFLAAHGDEYADCFGPKRLKAFRETLIARGVSRPEINKRITQIKKMFRWAASEELIPVDVSQALDTVANLVINESDAPEPKEVKPIDLAIVELTLPFMPPVIADMVRLQMLTGARPGEIARLRPAEIDRSFDDGAWRYSPAKHKTQRFGKQRVIFLGPPAQKILAPYLADRAADCPCFSPKEAEAQRRTAATANRKTPLSCGNRPGTNRAAIPQKRPGDCYTTTTYRQAIERACKLAKVEQWAPNRIRHTVATMIRRKHGAEAAQVILGHSRLSTTEIYAEKNAAIALNVVMAAS
jgi:integrase